MDGVCASSSHGLSLRWHHLSLLPLPIISNRETHFTRPKQKRHRKEAGKRVKFRENIFLKAKKRFPLSVSWSPSFTCPVPGTLRDTYLPLLLGAGDLVRAGGGCGRHPAPAPARLR